MGDGDGGLVVCRHIRTAQSKARRVERVEARLKACLRTDGQGQVAPQQIPALAIDLIERPAALQAVAQVRVDALTKQQIEGVVSKNLGRSGQGPMGKPQAIEEHPGHGFAWREGLLLIRHQPCVDHLNAAYIFDDRHDESAMIPTFDPERFPLCTSPALG
jgi:hypothetical protein